MNVIGSITAGAAGAAAVLAGINLYVSGRRELDKWTRESLVEVFVIFLDASFKQASVCRSILVNSFDASALDGLRGEILEAHDIATRALTRLRLLAPASVVDAAAELLNAEYALAKPCFLESPPNIDEAMDTIRNVRRCRAELLESARVALGLREKKGTGNFELSLSWRDLRNALDGISHPD